MVLDSDGESILNSEKSRLKANGVQEGAQVLTLMRRTAQLLQQRDRDVVEKERVQLAKRKTGLTIKCREAREYCLSTLLDLAYCLDLNRSKDIPLLAAMWATSSPWQKRGEGPP